MADVQQKEKVTGVYVPTAMQVRFNREWGGHRFTDEEVQRLLNGEKIEFDTVSKAGKPYTARGQLAENEYNGSTFWGFTLDGNSVPNEWCGHVFTEEEKKALMDGGTVYVQDAVSKKTGKMFSTTLSFKEEDGRKRLVPDFTKNE